MVVGGLGWVFSCTFNCHMCWDLNSHCFLCNPNLGSLDPGTCFGIIFPSLPVIPPEVRCLDGMFLGGQMPPTPRCLEA